MISHSFGAPRPDAPARRTPRALILAAGAGTRMRPLTETVPKVLLPLDGRPLLDLTLRWLAGEGIREIALNVSHLGHEVRDFAGDGSRWGVQVTWSEETTALGTAGALGPLAGFLDRTFLVIYGDVLTRAPLEPLIHRHFESDATATVALHHHPRPWEKGVAQVFGGHIQGFVEKPPQGSAHGNLVNAGIYVMEPEVFGHLPSTTPADFGIDVFPAMLAAGEPVAAYQLQDPLIDIGTPEAYAEATALAHQLWPELW